MGCITETAGVKTRAELKYAEVEINSESCFRDVKGNFEFINEEFRINQNKFRAEFCNKPKLIPNAF